VNQLVLWIGLAQFDGVVDIVVDVVVAVGDSGCLEELTI
jgi:hypothetical protein